MVKTNDNIDKFGAIDYVKGIGYYFLQYETKEKADFAKKKYKALKYTVNNDSVVKLCDTHNIPLATNLATAELLIRALDRGDLEWREMYK